MSDDKASGGENFIYLGRNDLTQKYNNWLQIGKPQKTVITTIEN